MMYSVMTIDNTVKRIDTESSHHKSIFSFILATWEDGS